MRRRALSHLLGRTIVGRRGVELWAGQLRCRVASNNSISCSTRATGVACVTARAGSRLPGDDGWRTADERRTTLVVPRTSLCERATPALAARPSPVRSAAESIRQSSRDGVRLLHFSVQRDHVHLLVEADAPCRLTGGIRFLRTSRSTCARSSASTRGLPGDGSTDGSAPCANRRCPPRSHARAPGWGAWDGDVTARSGSTNPRELYDEGRKPGRRLAAGANADTATRPGGWRPHRAAC